MTSFACYQFPFVLSSFFRRASSSILIAAYGLVCALSHAQTVNLGDDVARPIPGAGHDYVKGLSETVNPTNGNLTIKIDLPVPKGRGLTLPFAITYNSGEVHRFVSMLPGCGGIVGSSSSCSSAPPPARVNNGWSDSFPYATYSLPIVTIPPYNETCDMSYSYNFFDPAGGTHMLGLAAISIGHSEGSSYNNPNTDCSVVRYSPSYCPPNPGGGTNGWWAGCNGGYLYQAFASGGDDEVHAQSDLCVFSASLRDQGTGLNSWQLCRYGAWVRASD